MSGGMDSAACAYLLKERGHDVLGLHMRLREGSEETWESARKVADAVDVPIRLIDLRREFSDFVVKPFIREYARGRTPSPCPMCNRLVKVRRLLEAAERFGCKRLATGHYARVDRDADGPRLRMGIDRKKDQSYFLFALTRDQLDRLCLPLGILTKSAVRDLLKEQGIGAADSEESQELCFIPDGDYRAFLRRHCVERAEGPIRDIHGKRLGTHSGITEYTIGQRRGLGIPYGEPLYVVGLDPENNAVIVGVKADTYVERLIARGLNFPSGVRPNVGDRFQIKVRSTAEPAPCILERLDEDEMEIAFEKPQSSIAPGQAAVVYSGDLVVGGGWIERAA